MADAVLNHSTRTASHSCSLRICVVDDEPDHLKSFEQMLWEVLPVAAQQTGEPYDRDSVIIDTFDNAPDVLKLIELGAKEPDAFPYDVLIADVFMPREPGSSHEHPHGGAVRLYDAIKSHSLQDRVIMLIVSKNVVHAEDELARIDEEQRKLEVQWAFKLEKPSFLTSSHSEGGVGRDTWTATVIELITQRNNQAWRKENFLRLPPEQLISNTYFSAAKLKVDALVRNGQGQFILITGESGTGKEIVADYVSTRLNLINGRESFILRPGAEQNLAARLFGKELPTPREGLLERNPDALVFVDNFAMKSSKRHFLDDKLLELFKSYFANGRRNGVGEFFRLDDGVDAKHFSGAIILSCEKVDDLRRNTDIPPELVELLSRHHIHLPSLREDSSLIGPLARHFLKATNKELQFGGDASKLLSTYPWLGNLKELEDVVVEAAKITSERWVSAQDLRRAGMSYVQAVIPKPDVPWTSKINPKRWIGAFLRRLRRSGWSNEVRSKALIDIIAKVVSNVTFLILSSIAILFFAWFGFIEQLMKPNAAEWLPADNGAVPSNALLAGSEGNLQLYVCRIKRLGGWVVGKMIDGRGCIVVENGRAVEQYKSLPPRNIEVLKSNSSSFSWERRMDAPWAYPAGSIAVTDDSGSTSYVCRGQYEGNLLVGSVRGYGHAYCITTYHLEVLELPSFEVVISK